MVNTMEKKMRNGVTFIAENHLLEANVANRRGEPYNCCYTLLFFPFSLRYFYVNGK